MSEEKQGDETNRHAQRVECTLSRVDRSESRPGWFFLHLEGTQYIHDVRQIHVWEWDIEFDQLRFVELAQKILAVADPVTREQFVDRIGRLIQE